MVWGCKTPEIVNYYRSELHCESKYWSLLSTLCGATARKLHASPAFSQLLEARECIIFMLQAVPFFPTLLLVLLRGIFPVAALHSTNWIIVTGATIFTRFYYDLHFVRI